MRAFDFEYGISESHMPRRTPLVNVVDLCRKQKTLAQGRRVVDSLLTGYASNRAAGTFNRTSLLHPGTTDEYFARIMPRGAGENGFVHVIA
jgi:hypothetical protein